MLTAINIIIAAILIYQGVTYPWISLPVRLVTFAFAGLNIWAATL